MKKLLLITLLTLSATQAFSAYQPCAVASPCNDIVDDYNQAVAQYAPSENLLACSASASCSCYTQNFNATALNNLITNYNLFNKYGVM